MRAFVTLVHTGRNMHWSALLNEHAVVLERTCCTRICLYKLTHFSGPLSAREGTMRRGLHKAQA
jgi:hypothetical protein